MKKTTKTILSVTGAIAGAAASFTADQDDLCIVAADFLPVLDLTGVDLADGLNVQVFHLVLGVDDDGDAVERNDGLLQAGGLLVVLERAARQADVAAAFGDGLDAGAGAGGIIGDVDAFLFGESFAERADDLLHGGRAVGRDGGGILPGAAGERQRGKGNYKYSGENFGHLLHFDDLLSIDSTSCLRASRYCYDLKCESRFR